MAKDIDGFDLRDWDTVSAVKIGTLNQAIEAGHRTPPGFEQPLDIRGKDYFVRAGFKPWRVLSSGDGHILNMELDLEEVIVESGGESKFCGGGLAQITVRLELLPTGSKPSKKAEQHVLVLAKPTKAEPITVDKIELSEGNFRDQVVVENALAAWLNDHIATFTHVFAVVTLHEVLDLGDDFNWLKPTFSAYAFGRNANKPSESILAVLAMTQNRSPKGKLPQVDAGLVSSKDTVAYAISRPRVVHQLIAENLPVAFQGLETSDLTVDEEHWRIKLKRGRGPVLKNIEHEGKQHEVALSRLVVTVKETTILVESETKTKMFWGVYSVCSSKAEYKFNLIEDAQGNQKIGFEVIWEETSEHRTIVSDKRKNVKKYLALVGIILLAIAAIIALVIAFAALAPATVAVLAICGKAAVIAGVAALASGGLIKLQEWLLGDDGPSLDFMTLNAVAAISWCSGTNFKPRAVELDGVLRLAGQLGPDPHIDTLPLKAVPAFDPVAFQDQFADFMQKRAA